MTHNNTLSDWLSYLGSIHVSAIDMGLERLLPVFKQLSIQKNAFVITVAGTNGKGSTTKLIAQICQQAGLKTALYQSPHLLSFNERVQINGQPVDDETLIQSFHQVNQARIFCNLTLSFFEMTTLAAFLIFDQKKCDVWVLEVGLGGRLDAVNVIDPNLCVITNVAIDHTDWLGDDKEKIGYEKAGILRTGVDLVYGEEQMPNSVQNVIDELGVSCHQKSRTYDYRSEDKACNWIYSSEALTVQLPKPNLSLDNASTAVAAILASRLPIDIEHIRQGLKTARLAGRFDVQVLGCHWVFDVAHNPAGTHFLMEQFIPYWQNHKRQYANVRLYAIFSMLMDKDIQAVLSVVEGYRLPIDEWHIAKIDNPRAMPTRQIAKQLTDNLHNPLVYQHKTLALAAVAVQKSASKDDVVLVFGSFYTIGESLTQLNSV